MKNPKLHRLTLETLFLRKIRTGAQYYNQNHYTNFADNSIEIRPFEQSREQHKWPLDSIFSKMMKSLNPHNLKYLTKLNISIEASSDFNKSTLRHFASSIVNHFETLKQLEIRFLSCFKLDCENLRFFLGCFGKKIKSLTKFNIHFLGQCDIDDQGLKEIRFFLLKRFKHLKNLEMIIAGFIIHFDAEKTHYFNPKMEKMLEACASNYFEFECISWRTNIRSQGIARLCSDITRYLKNLESLTFQIPFLRGRNDVAVEHVVKIIAKLPNLKNLILSFDVFIDDEYVDVVSYAIGQKLNKLQSLTLWVHGPNDDITDEGLEKLASNIFPKLSQLTYFAFNLDHNDEVTDAGVTTFGQSIATNLKKLETLVLNFSSLYNLTPLVPSKLTGTFKNALQTLRKLVLNFQWIDYEHEFKEENHIFLPEQVQHLDLYLFHPGFLINETWKNLKQLSIAQNIYTESTHFLDIFSKSIPILKNLTQLKSVFTNQKNITDKNIKDLTLAIGTNLKNLTSLELGFSDCRLLTSECITLIGQNLCKKLERLVQFHVRFYGTEFDPESVISLIYLIATRLQELESLTLLFHGALEWNPISPILSSNCLVSLENLKRLKKVTLNLDLNEDEKIEAKQQLRKQLCHIPMLHLY